MAELNALNVINERLQTKTPVKKTRVQVEHETVCPYNVMGPPEANMLLIFIFCCRVNIVMQASSVKSM